MEHIKNDYIGAYERLTQNTPPKDKDSITAIKESMGSNADNFNWDEKKQFYFIVYSDSNAFVVKSLNIITCSWSFLKDRLYSPTEDTAMKTGVFPSVMQYEDKE